jgi:RimJ/RimL family protein N-acetyltransferase
MTHELRTERLILRPWRDEDLEPFAAMNADPRVMEHFPALLTRDETAAMIERIRAKASQHGFCWWAVEVPGIAPFIGFIGLNVPGFDAPFMPTVEIGWRLAAEHWGHGYAVEGARATLAFGFDQLALPEVVAFTAVGNWRSRRVMERIGMQHDPGGDFEHPLVPVDHRLRTHVLYRAVPQDHVGTVASTRAEGTCPGAASRNS